MNSGYYSEDEIICKAEELAESIMADIKAEYTSLIRGYDVSKTWLAQEEIDACKKKWMNNCGELEDLIGFLSMNDRHDRALVIVTEILTRIRKHITSKIESMSVRILFNPTTANNPVLQDGEKG